MCWLYVVFWSNTAPLENVSELPTCEIGMPFESNFSWFVTKKLEIDSLFVVRSPRIHAQCVDPVCGLILPAQDGGFAYNTREGEEVRRDDDLPLPCRRIEENDIVDSTTGEACHEWCKTVMGATAADWKFTPLCSGPLAGEFTGPSRMSQACGKAASHMRCRMFPPWAKYIVSLVYGLPGLTLAGYDIIRPRHAILERVLHNPLREDGFLAPGPFAAWYFAPIRVLTSGDNGAYELMFTIKAVLTMLEPPLDLFSAWSLFEDGDPLFALVTLFGFLTVMDPFQLRGYRAAAASWRDGYETKEYMQHKMHEGFNEAPLGACVALVSLFTTPGLAIHQMFLRSLNFGTTFFVTLPDAVKAKLMIDDIEAEPQRLDPGDAYAVHTAKAAWTNVAMASSVVMMPGVFGFLVLRQYKYDMQPFQFFSCAYSALSLCVIQAISNSLSMEFAGIPRWGPFRSPTMRRHVKLGFLFYNALNLMWGLGTVVAAYGLEPLWELCQKMIVPGLICLVAAVAGLAIVGLALRCEPTNKTIPATEHELIPQFEGPPEGA